MRMSQDRLMLLSADRPEDGEPWRRMWSRGAGSMSDAELLSLVLRNRGKGRSALELAEDMLVERDIAGLFAAIRDHQSSVISHPIWRTIAGYNAE